MAILHTSNYSSSHIVLATIVLTWFYWSHGRYIYNFHRFSPSLPCFIWACRWVDVSLASATFKYPLLKPFAGVHDVCLLCQVVHSTGPQHVPTISFYHQIRQTTLNHSTSTDSDRRWNEAQCFLASVCDGTSAWDGKRMGFMPWRPRYLTTPTCSWRPVRARSWAFPSRLSICNWHPYQTLVTPLERQWAHAGDLLLTHPESQIDSFILYIKGTILIGKIHLIEFIITPSYLQSSSG